MNLISLAFLLFSASLTAEEPASWGGKNGTFSASIVLSSTHISIENSLSLTATLTYPEGFQPQASQLRKNLLSYAGLAEPPFNLLKEQLIKPKTNAENQKTLQVSFELSPLLGGKHPLSLREIIFEPENSEKEPVVIFSPIFEITVDVPKESEFNFPSLIAPLMPLSQEMIIEPSSTNRIKYISPSSWIAEESKRNAAILKSKAIPWIYLAAACAVIFAVVLLKLLPPSPKSAAITREGERNLKLETLNVLANLSAKVEKTPPRIYFDNLEYAVKSYLDGKYQMEATISTTQELVKKMAAIPDDKARRELTQLFQHADQVKFANHKPSPEECLAASKTISKLIQEGLL
jgi:hypothetical protein